MVAFFCASILICETVMTVVLVNGAITAVPALKTSAMPGVSIVCTRATKSAIVRATSVTLRLALTARETSALPM